MKHLGDITKMKGETTPIVDIVTGGSPCQDLSVAGKRAGLDGERSGLYMEQIRVIKEMREEDRKNGRPNQFCRPRYMVWENVPGTFSSNGGEDFRAVLEEAARVSDPNAVIPRLEDGQKWTSAGTIVGPNWSIAWRLHDAQYWGVPQRRKRLCMLCDFNGWTAPEILFDPQYRGEAEDAEAYETLADTGRTRRSEVQPFGDGLSGDIAESGEEGKGTAAGTEGGLGATNYTLKIRGGCEVDSKGKKAGKGALIQKELSGTLGVTQDQTMVKTYGISPYASNAMLSDNPNSGIYEADTSRTLDLNGGSPACNQGGVAVVQKPLNGWDVQSKHIQPTDGLAEALYSGECRYGGGESYVMAVDAWNGTENECNGNLQASAAHNNHSNNVVRVSSS